MEVLIALAITAISLIPLLRLLVISISAINSASCLSQASLIANAKLAEIVSSGNPELRDASGTISNNNVVYKWQVNITSAGNPELEKFNLSDLKKVNVCVVWNLGQTKKQVSASTLISPARTVTETVHNVKGG